MSNSEQERVAHEWRERWQHVFTSTDPADREKAEKTIGDLYRLAGVPAPQFTWFDSPLAAIASTLPRDLFLPLPPAPVDMADWEKLYGWPSRKFLRRAAPAWFPGPLPPRLVGPLGRVMALRLGKLALSALHRKDIPYPQIEMSSTLVSAVQRALHDWVYAYTSRSEPFFELWFPGCLDTIWIARYQWWRDMLDMDYSETDGRMLDAWIAIVESCGWWYPWEHHCLVCERPVHIEMNQQRSLHSERGPAIGFRDGCVVWVLNGVVVPQWLVETPVDRIDPKRLLEIDNVEMRREFVRKVGVERICRALNAASVDKQEEYELLLLDLGNGRQRPFLKMLNPTIGTWHVEGVDPSCRTVAEALAWRNGTDVAPVTLT